MPAFTAALLTVDVSQSHRATLTQGSVRGHLVRMTLPMVAGLVAMMGFYFVDTLFVGQLGTQPLAAMSFTFPVVMTITSIGIGFMAGTSSVLARLIGRGDGSRVRRLTTDSLLLTLAVSAILALIGLLTVDPLFRLLGADEDLLPLIHDYMDIWYLSLPLVLTPMAAVGAIRATGDSSGQSLILIVASVVNIFLDPFLIFGLAGLPRLELQGAALASALARLVSVAIGYHVLQTKHGLLDLRLPSPAEARDSVAAILHIAGPAAGTNAIIPIGTGFVTALVAGQGAEAVAGFGAAFRIESVFLLVFFAMSAIIGPFVGQNLGAGQIERMADAVRQSIYFCLGFGALLAALLTAAAPPLAALFSDNPLVTQTTVTYLRLVPLAYGTAGIVMVVNAAFNGVGLPFQATGLSLIRVFGLYVPLAYLGAHLAGLTGIFGGILAANLVAGGLAFGWWRRRAPVAGAQ